MTEKPDLRYQWVTCAQCHKHFQVTPDSDYYNNTNDHDGLCEACLVGDLPVRVITLADLTDLLVEGLVDRHRGGERE